MIFPVRAEDPSSTIIHSAGRIVCPKTDWIVFSRNSSSSRTGETTTYVSFGLSMLYLREQRTLKYARSTGALRERFTRSANNPLHPLNVRRANDGVEFCA